MDPGTIALLFLALFYVLPLAHVALSRRAGAWRPPPGTRCPFGPRTGWAVMVLLLGPVGWLLFVRRAYGRSGSRTSRPPT